MRLGISIHALLAESDFACWYIKEMTANISIHALLAESDITAEQTAREQADISIHALLAESDCRDRKADVRNSLFLSTLSLRRATSQCRTFANGM